MCYRQHIGVGRIFASGVHSIVASNGEMVIIFIVVIVVNIQNTP